MTNQLARLAIIQKQELSKAQGKQFSPNDRLVQDYLKLLPPVLPYPLFCVALGNMLGDCSMKYYANTGRGVLRYEWGNQEYANYIYNLFYDYVLTPPREQVRRNANGGTATTYVFQTVGHPSLAVFWHLFHGNGKKDVMPSLISSLMNPLSLAVWYMDDGNLTDYRPGHGFGWQLNTQGFTVPAVERMVLELNAKYGLDCWMRLVKQGKPIICFPSASYPQFYDMIKDFVHPTFAYKLPAPR